MKLTRSTAHLILAPDLAALVLCAMRLGLRDTNGRRVGALRQTATKWTRDGHLQESNDALYRLDVRESA